jgi:hypothetical protein
MSNRRRPRTVHELRFVESVDAVLANPASLRCPDCDSTLGQPVRYSDQVVRLEVRHDETCPWFRRWSA